MSLERPEKRRGGGAPEKATEAALRARIKDLEVQNHSLVVANNRLVEMRRYLMKRIDDLEKACANMRLEKDLAAKGYAASMQKMNDRLDAIRDALEGSSAPD